MNTAESQSSAHSSQADLLSPLVATLDPRGRMDLRCLFGRAFAAPHDAVGPWRAPFHVVLRGACEIELPAQRRTLALSAGTLVVLPRGAAHVLRAAAPGQRARAVRQVDGAPVDLKTNVAQGAQAETEILCGEFEFGGRRRSALLEALPEPLVVAFAGAGKAEALESIVRLMAREIEQPEPGAAVIVAELSGALFTLALRAHLQAQPAHRGVLGLMRNARLAPALQVMLEQPERPWTVAALAALCHLSRASFARAFDRAAGTAPLALLTALRMEKAARLLAAGTNDSAAVGEAVGYASAAAFHRAFQRYQGTTPGRARRDGR